MEKMKLKKVMVKILKNISYMKNYTKCKIYIENHWELIIM